MHITFKFQITEYISLKKVLYSCVHVTYPWLMCGGWGIGHYGYSRTLRLSIEMWSLATFYSMAVWSPKSQISAYPKQILKWIHMYQQDQQALLGKHSCLQYKERMNGNAILIITLQIFGSRVLPTPPINHCKWCVWLWCCITRVADRSTCHWSRASWGY